MVKSPKFPRTYHLTFSSGATNDDKVLDSNDHFLNREIIITSKMDGSNVSISREDCFARTHAGPPTHASFNQFKAIHSQIKHLIPENLALYGEWIFAKHSIAYTALPSYLLIFHGLDLLWDRWLSWDELEKETNKLELLTVPVLFRGVIKTEKELRTKINQLMQEKEFDADEREGVVVRWADGFDMEEFSKATGKWVRKNHVQTDTHWKNQQIIKNGLKHGK